MRRGNQGSGVPRKWGGVQAKVSRLTYCFICIFQEFHWRFSGPPKGQAKTVIQPLISLSLGAGARPLHTFFKAMLHPGQQAN